MPVWVMVTPGRNHVRAFIFWQMTALKLCCHLHIMTAVWEFHTDLVSPVSHCLLFWENHLHLKLCKFCKALMCVVTEWASSCQTFQCDQNVLEATKWRALMTQCDLWYWHTRSSAFKSRRHGHIHINTLTSSDHRVILQFVLEEGRSSVPPLRSSAKILFRQTFYSLYAHTRTDKNALRDDTGTPNHVAYYNPTQPYDTHTGGLISGTGMLQTSCFDSSINNPLPVCPLCPETQKKVLIWASFQGKNSMSTKDSCFSCDENFLKATDQSQG